MGRDDPPEERSSKIPTSRKRTVINAQKPKARDPRFDSRSGSYNPDLFKKSYSFLFNEVRPQELSTLRSEIKKTKDWNEKEKLKKLLDRELSVESSLKQKEKEREMKSKIRKAETEMIKAGKKPFHYKKADYKKFELIEKFKNVEEKHGGENGKELDLDKMLEKRRTRMAKKQKKFLPRQ